MSLLSLYNLIQQQKLVTSAENSSPIDPPSVFQGDNPTVQYQALQKISAGLSSALAAMDVDNYSVDVTLLTTANVTLGTVTDWVKDSVNNVYTGQLTLNGTSVSSALAGVTVFNSLSVYLKAKITDTTTTVASVFTSYLGETSLVKTQ